LRCADTYSQPYGDTNRDADSHAYSDGDSNSNCHGHGHGNTNLHANCLTYGNTDRDSYSYSYGETNGYLHSNIDSNSHSNSNVYRYGHGYGNSDCNAYGYSDGDCNRNSYIDADFSVHCSEFHWRPVKPGSVNLEQRGVHNRGHDRRARWPSDHVAKSSSGISGLLYHHKDHRYRSIKFAIRF